MDNTRIKRRKWWIAALLNFFVSGLGQVYNGQVTKGLFFYFLISTWSGLTFSFTYYIMKSPMTHLGLGLLFFMYFISFIAYLLVLLESIWTAINKGKDNVLKGYNRWYVYLIVILVVSGVNQSVSLASSDNLLKAYKIPSESMRPTLEAGDYLMCNQLYYRYNNPERGDLIIFKYPKDESMDYIKRIVAVPGDSIEIRGKEVFINGQKTEESYAMYTGTRYNGDGFRRNYGPYVIGDNDYFVLGDNRDNSDDSRFWGTVKRHEIQGKAVFIYFSWDNDISSWNIVGRLLSIRFSRIGKII